MRTMVIGTLLFGLGIGSAWGHTHPLSGIPHPSLPECRRDDPQLILPDLVPDVPASVRTRISGGERFVEFTTAIANLGPGVFMVEGKTVTTAGREVTVGYQRIDRRDGTQCAREAGVFEFHRAHSHFHFDDFVNYELRTGHPDLSPIASTGQKASYCLIDIEPVRGFEPFRHPMLRPQLTCNEREGLQGISVGYKDVYDRTLPGQLLSLDRPNLLPGGSYFLVNDVDPDNILWEVNDGNNRSAASFGVSNPAGVTTSTPTLRSGPATPTPTSSRPTGHRPPRPTRVARPPRPVFGTPTRGLSSTSTPTPTRTPRAEPPVANCNNACPHYNFSQMRLTWYDAGAGGLNLSYFVAGGGCPALTPEAGEQATIQMTRWLTDRGVDTGRSHVAAFTLGANGAGATSTGGTASISQYRGWQQITYRATTPPIASPADGANFPVVFDLCLTVGDQAVKARMVCQEKNRGLLCHEG